MMGYPSYNLEGGVHATINKALHLLELITGKVKAENGTS